MKRISLFLLLVLVITLSGFAQQPLRQSNITGMRLLSNAVADQFGRWSLTSSTRITSTGSFTVKVDQSYVVVPDGTSFQPIATNVPLLINDFANTETVTPSSVSCQQGSGLCSFTASFSHTHVGGFTVQSGTYGLQEAINSMRNTGGWVLVSPDWQGTTSMITSTAVGLSAVGIKDSRNSAEIWYTWNGSHYVSSFSITSSTTGFAPNSSKFILNQPDVSLANAQALSALSTGLVKNTTTTGILSIAMAGTDYEVPITFSSPLVRTVNTITIANIPNADLQFSSFTLNGSSISLGGSKTLTLASSDFAAQGTATTVLHGSAAGNPSFGSVVSADLNITTTSCTNQLVKSIASSGVGTCQTVTSSYVDTSVAVTGVDINTSSQVTVTHLAAALPVNQGGTNCISASITCFNNITGFTSSGTTGTTSTNLVYSGSPTIVTPTIASFANATHNHQASAGGGTLAEAALVLTDITTNNASTLAHGFLPKLDGNAAHYLDGTGAYTTPAGGGTVTTTGSPASGNLTKFSGTTSVTNGDLSGDVTTSSSLVTTVAKVNGVAYSSGPSTHTVAVITASNTATYKTVPDCTDTGGNHLNYTQSTDLFSCGTSSSGGGGTFTGSVTANQIVVGTAANVLGSAAVVNAATGGTGQDTSGWSGIPTINSGTWTQNNIVTSTQVIYGSTANALASSAGLTYNGLGLSVTSTSGTSLTIDSSASTTAKPMIGFKSNASGTPHEWDIQVGGGNKFEWSDTGSGGSVGMRMYPLSGGIINIEFSRIATSSSATGGYLCIDGSQIVYNDSTACISSSARFKNTITDIAFSSSSVSMAGDISTASTLYQAAVGDQLAQVTPSPSIQSATDLLLMLRPVNYYLNAPADFNQSRQQFGFIAEEVEKIDSRLVTYQSDGQIRSVDYRAVTPILTKGFQEHDARISDLEQRLAAAGIK